MGFLLSLFTGGKLVDLLRSIFDFLRSPVGIACIIAAAAVGGHLHGKWGAEAECRLLMDASRDNAERIDTRNDLRATSDMLRQREALRLSQERELATQRQAEEDIADAERKAAARAGTTPAKPASCARDLRPTDAEWSRLRQ